MVHVTPRQGSKSLPVLHLRPAIVSILSRGYINNIRFCLSMEKNRLTRDGTAEPVSRDQFLRHELGQGKSIFSVQLTMNRIGHLTRLILHLLYVMPIHTYIQ